MKKKFFETIFYKSKLVRFVRFHLGIYFQIFFYPHFANTGLKMRPKVPQWSLRAGSNRRSFFIPFSWWAFSGSVSSCICLSSNGTNSARNFAQLLSMTQQKSLLPHRFSLQLGYLFFVDLWSFGLFFFSFPSFVILMRPKSKFENTISLSKYVRTKIVQIWQ